MTQIQFDRKFPVVFDETLDQAGQRIGHCVVLAKLSKNEMKAIIWDKPTTNSQRKSLGEITSNHRVIVTGTILNQQLVHGQRIKANVNDGMSRFSYAHEDRVARVSCCAV